MPSLIGVPAALGDATGVHLAELPMSLERVNWAFRGGENQ